MIWRTSPTETYRKSTDGNLSEHFSEPGDVNSLWAGIFLTLNRTDMQGQGAQHYRCSSCVRVSRIVRSLCALAKRRIFYPLANLLTCALGSCGGLRALLPC